MWYVTIKKRVARELRKRGKIPIEVESATMALIAELRLGPAVIGQTMANYKTKVVIKI